MPTAAIKGRSFSPPFAKSSGKSTWRSSSAPISQRALRSCPSDGSSNAPSPGSTAAAVWPRIGSASTERPWRSCASPQSASCCESSVKKHHDPGQTLKEVWIVVALAGANGIGFVMQMFDRQIGTDRPLVDDVQPKIKDLGDAMIDPDDGVIVNGHGFSLSLNRRYIFAEFASRCGAVRSVGYQHRHRHCLEHGPRDAAENSLLQPRMAVSAHHQQSDI